MVNADVKNVIKPRATSYPPAAMPQKTLPIRPKIFIVSRVETKPVYKRSFCTLGRLGESSETLIIKIAHMLNYIHKVPI